MSSISSLTPQFEPGPIWNPKLWLEREKNFVRQGWSLLRIRIRIPVKRVTSIRG